MTALSWCGVARAQKAEPEESEERPATRQAGGTRQIADRGADEGSPSESDERVRLSDRGELERIIELYMAGDYQTCSSQLSTFLDPEGDSPFEEEGVIEQGRLYFASCALLEGRRKDARLALRAALEENPLMHSPDSLTFPPPVVSLFLEVRDEVQQLITESEKEQVVRLRRENELARRRAEQREYRERELEKLAREEHVVAKSSRYLASIPFGVGQFQNGNKALGATLLTTEALLLATAVTSGLILEGLTSRAAEGNDQIAEPARHDQRTRTAYETMTWSSWGFIGVSALGILEAHLSFKPERKLEKRTRPLPKELELPPEPDDGDGSFGELGRFQVRPDFGVVPGGGHLGISGRF